MNTTDTPANPYAEFFTQLEPIKAAALEQGADPSLVNYLVSSAAMQRYVSQHNARALGQGPRLEYPSFEEFTLRHGQVFVPPAVPRPKGLRKGRDKQCFMNAAHAAMEHEDWQYVEGYASSYIPAHHAWCLDADGNVVETTWRTPGDAYLGVVFPDEVWRLAVSTTRVWGVFGFDLMRAPYTPEAFKAHLRTLRPGRTRR